MEIEMKNFFRFLVSAALCCLVFACSPAHEGIVSESEMSKLTVKTDMSLDDGKIELLGYFVEPIKPRHGEPFKVTTYWRFKEQIPEGYELFLHFESENGEERFTENQKFLNGAVKELALGKIIMNKTEVEKIPQSFDTDEMYIRGGFFKDKDRLAPDAKSNDGKNRMNIGHLKITKPNIKRKSMDVFVIAGNSRDQTKIDGELRESYWQNASRDDKFWVSDGSALSKAETAVMTVMDHNYLYVAFDVKDSDIHAELKENDAPIYDHDDVVEIFIDPTGTADPYYEIQVSAAGVKFDSRFNGRRKNRTDSWDSGIKYAVKLNGTLNDPSDEDTGWSAEIAIPWKSLVQTPPKDGDTWKVFFHRINRYSNKKSTREDFTSWTPAYSGDLHNIKFMGNLVFVYEEIL